MSPRAFPSWITIPSYQDLATGRRWHFFFAWLLVSNGLVYLVWGFASRHFGRDLLPSLRGASPYRDRDPRPSAPALPARRGGEALQCAAAARLSRRGVRAVPAGVLTGLTMSPGIDSAVPQLLTLFGGRQTARLIHFVAASGSSLFVVVHLVMVLVSGVWNNIRSMITGWYDLGEQPRGKCMPLVIAGDHPHRRRPPRGDRRRSAGSRSRAATGCRTSRASARSSMRRTASPTGCSAFSSALTVSRRNIARPTSRRLSRQRLDRPAGR